jgi:hypothetical protein
MHVPHEHNNQPNSDVLSVWITVRVIVLFVGASITIIVKINISKLIKCGKALSKHGKRGVSVILVGRQIQAQDHRVERNFLTVC